MRSVRAVVTGGVTVLLGAALLVAAPSSGSNAPGTSRQVRARLTKPWSEMTSLTDKEKSQILDIHRKAVEQIHEIEAREKKDILALLTPEQRKEVEQIEAKDKQEQKERRSPRGSTSRPASGSGGSSDAK